MTVGPHPFFNDLEIPQLSMSNFDDVMNEQFNLLVAVFFWGHNCPNCDIAKRSLHQEKGAVRALGLTWFHVNTYEDFDLGTKFGLHGIPTFLFFYRGKRLGKISPFPGIDAFLEAVHTLCQQFPEGLRSDRT